MWVKKNKEFKGKNYYYSLKNILRKENKIDKNFELVLNNLTLEEIIGLRLELACSYINNKLYNFNIYKSIRYITKEAVIMFALSSTRTMKDAASFLGLKESDFRRELKKYQIDLTQTNYNKKTNDI